MLFAAYKNESGWGLIPQDGPFASQVVAEVEAFSMDKVRVEARLLVGRLKSVWGATILVDNLFDDIDTLKSMCFRKNFDLRIGIPLWFDYDGLHSKIGKVSALRLASAFGDKLFGQEV